MSVDQKEPATRPLENRLRVLSCGFLCLVEVVLYFALAVILCLAVVYALFAAGQTLWLGLASGDSAKIVVAVIDRLLVALMLVEILHTVRISIRSHTLVTEPFLVVGLIASIRRMLVITLDAANLTSPANWANDGQAKLHASMFELAVLGVIIMVFVISIHLLRKSQSPYEEKETARSEPAPVAA